MDDDAVSPVVGTVLLVAITLVLTGAVFLLGGQSDVEETPRVAFRQDPEGAGRTLTMAAVDGRTGAVDWSRVSVVGSGTAACTLPTGPLDAGDVVTCTSEGTLAISYELPSGDTVLLFDGRVRQVTRTGAARRADPGPA